MTRIVIDTNVFVSGLLTPGGNCSQIIMRLLKSEFTLILDSKIYQEYREVFSRSKFNFNLDWVSEFLTAVSQNAIWVQPSSTSIKLPDPEDLKFLAAALAGKAKFLVTGNLKHFPEKICQPIRIVSPQKFLAFHTSKNL